MKKLILIIVLILGGCSFIQPSDDSILAGLAAVTQEDLDAAIVMAQADGDVLALACYQTLKPTIGHLSSKINAETKGIISTYQKARGIKRGLKGNIPDTIRLGCGGMLIEDRGLGFGLGGMVGK